MSGPSFLGAECLCVCLPKVSSVWLSFSMCTSCWVCVLGLDWCVPSLLSPGSRIEPRAEVTHPPCAPCSPGNQPGRVSETKSRLRQELGPLLQPAQAPGGNCGSHRSDLPTVPGCQEARLPAGLCCQLPPWAWARSSVSRAQPAEGPH